MKILKIVGILVVLLLFIVYGVLFTGFGNNLLKPKIEQIAKEKTGFDVVLEKFDLNFGSIDAVADINGEISAIVNGKYSLFSQSFDLNYEISARNLETFKLNLDEPMGLGGQIRGKIKDFDINGVGNAFDSDIKFLANIKEFKPFHLDLNAKGINAKKALAIAGLKDLASGEIDAIAKVENAKGDANITSNNLVINKNALKDKNISFSEDIAVSLNSLINFEGDLITANSSITSDLANANASKTLYHLDSKNLESDFSINLPNLAKLQPITKQKLNGKADLSGDLKMANNKLETLNFTLDGFGGSADGVLKDSRLEANLNSLKVGELISVLAFPKAVDGELNGKISVEDIYNTQNISGLANITLSKGKINSNELKKLVNIDFPKDSSFSINSDTTIKNGVINSNSNLSSNLLNIPSIVAEYDLNSKNLDAKFSAKVDDLAKLKTFTKQSLKGSVDANGEVSLKNNALSKLNLNIKTLGGEIVASSNGKNLDAKISNLNINDIFGLIGQESPASGSVMANINLSSIDMKNLNGVANLSIKNGVLNEKTLSKMLNKEFPKGIKFSLNADSNIAKSVANFSSNINSDLANLSKFDGSFDINTQSLNSNYEADVKDLSKFKFITGRAFRGSVSANGELKKAKDSLIFSANSNLYNGKFKATLNNDILKATFDKFQVSGLTDMLDFSHFYDGVGDLIFNYSTSLKKGDFSVVINEGRLTRSGLTDAVSLLTMKDITKEIFENSFIKGVVDNNIVTFDANFKAKRMELNATKGSLHTLTSAINIPITMNIEKTDLYGDITGTTKDPKVNLKSDYLDKKIDKAIDKGLDKLFGTKKEETQTSGETGTTDGADSLNQTKPTGEELLKDGVKDLLKGLF